MFKTLLWTALFFVTTSFAEPSLELDQNPDYQLGESEQQQLGTREDDIGLAPGETVPAFSSTTHEGGTVSFEQLLEKAPLLVIFYRGGWCPYCNIQIQQLSQRYPEFAELGITPVLISADKVDGAALAQRAYEIPFPVLSDTNLGAHEAFQVVMQIGWAMRKLYSWYGVDLQQWSGRDDGKFAVSSAFLVNNEGKVLWAHSSKEYESRPSPDQLLSVLPALLEKEKE